MRSGQIEICGLGVDAGAEAPDSLPPEGPVDLFNFTAGFLSGTQEIRKNAHKTTLFMSS
jgi:hypothetical protein